MIVTLSYRSIGVHREYKRAEIPGAFRDYVTRNPSQDRGGQKAYSVDEPKLLAALPEGFLPAKPREVLLTINESWGGTGQTGLTLFRNWAKYFSCYVLGLEMEVPAHADAVHPPGT